MPSQDDPLYKRLAIWVGDQRYAFKAGRLSKERIEKLNEIGFVWSSDDVWTTRYDEMVAYKNCMDIACYHKMTLYTKALLYGSGISDMHSKQGGF